MPIFASPKKTLNALCLGGGGARGYAHIGALKAFEEEGLKFDIVAGTSVGSMIAGLYAAGIPVSQMELFGDELTLRELHFGFVPNDPLKIGNVVKKLLGNMRIEALKIPYYAVAVDLVTAKQVIFDKGPLFEAISASCAVPIFFKPLIKDKLHLVDGGLLNNIPADVCRMMGATNVVTVDINPTRGGGTEGVGIMDVAKATLSIMTAGASVQGLIDSDVIIAPDLSAYKSTKKEGHTDMIRLGYEAAKEKMSSIKELFGIKEKKVKPLEIKGKTKKQQKQEKKEQKRLEKEKLKKEKAEKKNKL